MNEMPKGSRINIMTLREEIQERIAEYDDVMLRRLSEQLDLLERERALDFSDTFVSTVREIKASNAGTDPDELMSAINGAVRDARRR